MPYLSSIERKYNFLEIPLLYDFSEALESFVIFFAFAAVSGCVIAVYFVTLASKKNYDGDISETELLFDKREPSLSGSKFD